MSISSALTNAYSGLSAISRAAETVSNNVANATTEGYSRREVQYSSLQLGGVGGGVKIEGISRATDQAATSMRMRAEASFANATTTTDAMSRLTNLLGQPGNPGALAVRFSDFDAALSSAIIAPDSTALQNGILSKATSLAATFANISREITDIRVNADAEISRQVKLVNSSLKEIEQLNNKIGILSASGRDVAVFQDQRQGLIDVVNKIIPVRQAQTSNGQIALFTVGGAVLLNDTARELGFAPTAMMTPDMTLASGALSGLTLNGKLMDIGVEGGRLEGGSLASNFYVRDTMSVNLNSQIDGLARDLVERFQDVSVDPTLTAGMAGLFTDGGSAFNPLNEVGLAERLAINTRVDPASGGELWRLRDGIGALAPGASGASGQLMRMQAALSIQRTPNTGVGISMPMSATGFAQEITSSWALDFENQNQAQAHLQAEFSTLRTSELNVIGVDTDREMQSLLIVEQAYAANARVVSVIDRLMKTLLEM